MRARWTAVRRAPREEAPLLPPGVASWEDHDLVFCTGNERISNPNNVFRTFAEILARRCTEDRRT